MCSNKLNPKRRSAMLAVGLAALSIARCYAQSTDTANPARFDLTMTYQQIRSNPVGSSSSLNFIGGATDFSINIRHGFSVFADVTGEHASQSAGGSPLNFVASLAGPQYRRRFKAVSIFGEAGFGAANAFASALPGSSGSIAAGNGIRSSATCFATLVGGGLEFDLKKRLSLRLPQVDWLRTNFPNAASNAQNQLGLSAGLTFHLF